VDEPVRHRWSKSDRFVPRTFVRPAQRFMDEEAAGAAVMLVAALVALVWANSPWQDSYFTLWGTPLEIALGDSFHIELTLGEWVNDALMTIFFFVVSLEIKRELTSGELSDPKKAALPVIAALGGMIGPAMVFLAFNAGTDAQHGWGIPVATDIAFAVGVVTLAGPRVPPAAKLFILTLAIADDVGGIVVIALFYAKDLAPEWLLIAALVIGVVVALARSHVRATWVYLAAGAVLWFALHESGIHATLAGVALGLLTPTWAFHDPKRFGERAYPLVDKIQATFDDDKLTVDELEHNEVDISELIRLSRESSSPLSRLVFMLSPLVAFVIVPIFALANAGVTFTGDAVGGLFNDRVLIGVALGLIVGKTIGVFSAAWLGVRLGVGALPTGARWAHIFGLAVTAGIGFTVALFVTSIAFTEPAMTDSAKMGIFIGSFVAGVAGFLFLRSVRPQSSPSAS
jgi:NhaA family Na+:H+ antiporter